MYRSMNIYAYMMMMMMMMMMTMTGYEQMFYMFTMFKKDNNRSMLIIDEGGYPLG